MSENINKAQRLEAEAKALRRAEKRFWSDVESREEEVLAYLDAKKKDKSDILTSSYIDGYAE